MTITVRYNCNPLKNQAMGETWKKTTLTAAEHGTK